MAKETEASLGHLKKAFAPISVTSDGIHTCWRKGERVFEQYEGRREPLESPSKSKQIGVSSGRSVLGGTAVLKQTKHRIGDSVSPSVK